MPWRPCQIFIFLGGYGVETSTIKFHNPFCPYVKRSTDILILSMSKRVARPLVVFNMKPDEAQENGSETKNNVLVAECTLLSIIYSSDDGEGTDGEGVENDALNVSCHGRDFKRMMKESKHCDEFEFAVKRRKLQTQLDLMKSNLKSMTFHPQQEPSRFEVRQKKESFGAFDGSKSISEKSSDLSASLSCNKRQREMPDETLKVKSENLDGHLTAPKMDRN